MVGESPSPLSPVKPFPFLILAATALAVLKTDAHRAGLSVEAGEEVKIPCPLEGPRLTWYWIPRYPICAGFSHGGKKEIFSTTSAGEDLLLLERFQRQAEKQGEKGKGNLILVLKSLHMNDSGTFYCSNGNKNSSKISVSVELGRPYLKCWRVWSYVTC
ncbi:megakaryocyte and platelet inhibitory receptor G6b-like [Zootoca vivipara]|uniref:megakaryocyte and platelet inhibitory receptor G6b-like n=1 Tax=Zootoca vivipara TaxID=8524 RepID=UPI00293B9C7A|nr:megakaryocyte and platelet inhibitory receptor G6b-like [Zootoca vivipara]